MEFTNHNKKVCFVINDKTKKDIFISIFSLLKSASSQINLTIDKETFHIQGMDKSHVCLFDLTLTNKWFSYYEVNQKHNLCFDASIFYSMINTKSSEQALLFTLEDDTSEYLLIEFKNSQDQKSVSNKSKLDFNKIFKLPLIEYEYEEMNIPNVDYDAEFFIQSKKVTDILSQLHNFGDDLNIICSLECIKFKTYNNSVEMRVDIPVDELSAYSVNDDETNEEIVNVNYSLIYISKMCITNKLTEDIEFCLNKELPMKIEYYLEDKKCDSEIASTLKFYIAPKLMDD